MFGTDGTGFFVLGAGSDPGMITVNEAFATFNPTYYEAKELFVREAPLELLVQLLTAKAKQKALVRGTRCLGEGSPV